MVYCVKCGASPQAATPLGLPSQIGEIISFVVLGCSALFFIAIGICFVFLGLGAAENRDWMKAIAITVPGIISFLVTIFLLTRKK